MDLQIGRAIVAIQCGRGGHQHLAPADKSNMSGLDLSRPVSHAVRSLDGAIAGISGTPTAVPPFRLPRRH